MSINGASTTSARSSLICAACAEKFFATCAITSTPTMSPRRNVPVFGQPSAAPVSVSTSSIVSPCCLHQANRIAHRERADAVRDEVRRVVRVDDRLAQPQIAEVLDRGHIGRIGVRRRDNLKQPHVARRIEEVRAEPVAAQLHRHAFDDLVDGQAAGVARNDRVGAAMLLHLVEQRALDLKILRDHFDDPVAVGDQRKIVVEVADRDQARALGRIERRGLRLLQSIERGENDLVPLLLRRIGVGPGGTMSSRTTGRPALVMCAAMREPMVPAPRTATLLICLMFGR